MPLTITVVSRHQVADYDVVKGTIAFSSSYPTGGESYSSAAKFGLSRITRLKVFPVQGYTFEHDATNKKIKAYTGGGSEVVNATDLSSVVAQFEAEGYM